MVDPPTLREFFGIEWANNVGNLLRQFTEQLGKWIPVDIKDLSDGQKKAVVRQLGISDTSDDPDKIYCIDVRRTGTRADGSLKERSSFNSQKSEFLRPELYVKFKDDLNLSFYYSIDPSAEKTDGQIIASVAARESTQLRRE